MICAQGSYDTMWYHEWNPGQLDLFILFLWPPPSISLTQAPLPFHWDLAMPGTCTSNYCLLIGSSQETEVPTMDGNCVCPGTSRDLGLGPSSLATH